MPVTVAQHLRRLGETQIVSVLSRSTAFEVKLAQDGKCPRGGVVYISPPD
ncbi:chemotaxis protein CheB [Streptomyces xanthochromogenes]